MDDRKIDEFKKNIKNQDFFYHITMPRSGTNYVASLIENITKAPRFDKENEPFSKYISNLDYSSRQKEPIFFSTHECFNNKQKYSGCEFVFSDNEKLIVQIEDFRKIIVQIRDPVEIYYSLCNLGVNFELNFDMEYYNEFISKWCADYENGRRTYGNKFIILYDDLVVNKFDLISELCNFLDVPFDKEFIFSIIESVGNRHQFISKIKTDEIHLKNSHTLDELYSIKRKSFIDENIEIYEQISVETLKKHFKQRINYENNCITPIQK